MWKGCMPRIHPWCTQERDLAARLAIGVFCLRVKSLSCHLQRHCRVQNAALQLANLETVKNLAPDRSDPRFESCNFSAFLIFFPIFVKYMADRAPVGMYNRIRAFKLPFSINAIRIYPPMQKFFFCMTVTITAHRAKRPAQTRPRQREEELRYQQCGGTDEASRKKTVCLACEMDQSCLWIPLTIGVDVVSTVSDTNKVA
jgi:hypothetical protein